MKKNIKTIESNLFDIGLGILLFITTIILAYSIKSCNEKLDSRPSETDLVQQQEMIDYAKSQGRTIQVY